MFFMTGKVNLSVRETLFTTLRASLFAILQQAEKNWQQLFYVYFCIVQYGAASFLLLLTVTQAAYFSFHNSYLDWMVTLTIVINGLLNAFLYVVQCMEKGSSRICSSQLYVSNFKHLSIYALIITELCIKNAILGLSVRHRHMQNTES